MLILQDYDVTHTTEWFPASSIPSGGTTAFTERNELYGTAGVYQVIHSKDIDAINSTIIHKDIGYTGMSGSILGRIYDFRVPSGSHGAARFCRQNNIPVEQRYVRILYTEKYRDLERAIHEETNKQFGYRFKWIEASAGNTGKKSMIIDYAESLSSDEIIETIIVLKEIGMRKVQEEWIAKINS